MPKKPNDIELDFRRRVNPRTVDSLEDFLMKFFDNFRRRGVGGGRQCQEICVPLIVPNPDGAVNMGRDPVV